MVGAGAKPVTASARRPSSGGKAGLKHEDWCGLGPHSRQHFPTHPYGPAGLPGTGFILKRFSRVSL